MYKFLQTLIKKLSVRVCTNCTIQNMDMYNIVQIYYKHNATRVAIFYYVPYPYFS
jgi:hypothetical protein